MVPTVAAAPFDVPPATYAICRGVYAASAYGAPHGNLRREQPIFRCALLRAPCSAAAAPPLRYVRAQDITQAAELPPLRRRRHARCCRRRCPRLISPFASAAALSPPLLLPALMMPPYDAVTPRHTPRTRRLMPPSRRLTPAADG